MSIIVRDKVPFERAGFVSCAAHIVKESASGSFVWCKKEYNDTKMLKVDISQLLTTVDVCGVINA